jgi:hypothetical protein
MSVFLSVANKPFMLSVIMLSVVMLSVIMLSVIYAECRYAECRYGDCRGAVCNVAGFASHKILQTERPPFPPPPIQIVRKYIFR